MHKEELEQQLLNYNRAYREGKPLMSDEEFDQLLDQYKAEFPKSYHNFRKTLFESSGEVKHKFPVGSLEKIKDGENADEEIQHFIQNDPDDSTYAITEKIDGISMTLTYENGILKEALTRGDGNLGVDKINKLSFVVPRQIEFKGSIIIRGEVTLTYDTFDLVKELENFDFKNLRNTTTGIVNKDKANPKTLRCLSFIGYRLLDAPDNLRELINGSQEREIAFIASQGFVTPPVVTIEKKNFTRENLNKIFDAILETKPLYQIDGIVIQKNGKEHLLEHALIPKGTIAFKFNQLVTETTLNDIQWQVSKSGYLNPVGLLEPVELGGATVSRCTLHNLKCILDNRLRKGIKIRICKSGDIIPYFISTSVIVSERPWDTVEEVCKDFLPKKCPSCGSEDIAVKNDGMQVRCMNGENCPAQLFGKLEFFLSNVGVEGAKKTSLENWGIKTFKDLSHFIETNNPQGKNQEKFLNELKTKVLDKKLTLEDIVSSMDWDGIGKEIWAKIFSVIPVNKLIVLYYNWLCKDDQEAKDEIYKTMNSIKGIADKTVINIALNFKENMISIKQLTDFTNGFQLAEPVEISVDKEQNKKKGKFTGLNFVFTGALTKPRKEWVKIIKELGGNIQDHVSSETDYVVTNDVESGSSKMKKAKQLMIPILSESELEKRINN